MGHLRQRAVHSRQTHAGQVISSSGSPTALSRFNSVLQPWATERPVDSPARSVSLAQTSAGIGGQRLVAITGR